jgi:hypothetical protein
MTALQIVQQACGELGLPVPDAVAGTTEETNIQMLALLNSAGYDLAANYQWEELTRTQLVNLNAVDDLYDLPTDYNFYLDSTGWDRTNRWPLLGPVSSQEWQALVASKVQAVSRTYYRLVNKKLEFWPKPVSDRVIALEYNSLAWVQNGLDPTQYLTRIEHDSDTPVLNDWLLVKFLKLKTWAAKGFDTTMLTAEFQNMFNSISAKSKGSRVLSLAPKTGTVFIGVQNVPEGNWVR